MKRICLTSLTIIAALGCAVFPATAGTIYITDFVNNTVDAYSSTTGTFLGTVVSSGTGGLDGASGIRVGPNGDLFVTSQNTNTVVRFDAVGNLLSTFVPAGSGGLNSPQDLLFAPNGNLLVVSSANDEILQYSGTTGALVGTFSTLASPDHDGPINLAFGPDGNLYVTAFDGGRILKLDGTTGALLGESTAVADTAFVGITFGPNGSLLASGINTTDFTGSVFSYNPLSMTENGIFIANGVGGLVGPGALSTDSAGRILVLDAGTASLLRYDGTSGAYLDTLVAPGSGGLAVPLFFTTSVPEPSSMVLAGFGLVMALAYRRRNWLAR